MRADVRIRDAADAAAARQLLGAQGIGVARPGEPADLLVVDEWTPQHAPHVHEARARGVPVTLLAELVLQRAAGPVVGVTGAAGKTSTCRALEAILRACGTQVSISATARSGNAWPDHSLAGGCGPDAVTVAELTSTHLCHMRHVHPDVAVVTTIRPDHLELHGTMDDYVAAKRRLVDNLAEADALVLPVDDPSTVTAVGPCPARPVWFGECAMPSGDGAFVVGDGQLLRWGDEQVPCHAGAKGTALRAALAAAAAAMALGEQPRRVASALAGLPAVRHRMHAHQGPRGITLIDDTMAATPLKAMAALEHVGRKDLVVLVGGDDAPDGVPVHASPEEQRLVRDAVSRARRQAMALVAFGPARGRITGIVTPDAQAPDLRSALEAAIRACPDGGTVLVSPMFPLRPDERLLVADLA